MTQVGVYEYLATFAGRLNSAKCPPPRTDSVRYRARTVSATVHGQATRTPLLFAFSSLSSHAGLCVLCGGSSPIDIYERDRKKLQTKFNFHGAPDSARPPPNAHWWQVGLADERLTILTITIFAIPYTRTNVAGRFWLDCSSASPHRLANDRTTNFGR